MVQTEFAIKTAKSFISDCNAEGLFFDKVFLFGSYATGSANEWSDIDLLLVSKRFTVNAIENLKIYLKVNAQYPVLETHSYPTDYFLKGDAFLKDILKKAVEIK